MLNLKKLLLITISILTFVLAYRLRVRDFAIIPLPGQSMDEYSNSWVGLSLIRLGIPIGMSGMTGYGSNDYRYINVDRVFQSTANGNPYSLNYPWFDHPPLMGLISGGFAYLKGAQVFEDTLAVIIRKPVIFMGIISVLLVGILGFVISGWEVALGSSILYATVPLFVLQSRFVQSENGMILFFLSSVIFLTIYLKNQKLTYLFLSAVFAGIATLFKLSGISVYLTVTIVLLLQTKSLRSRIYNLVSYFIISLPITSLFPIFGLAIDWPTFVNVLSDNSSRFYGLGMAAIQNLWLETRLTHGLYLTDHWPMVFWISFFIYSTFQKTLIQKIPSITVVSYLITYLFFGSWPYGWYTIPFWPFLTIVFIQFLSENTSIFTRSTLLFIPITQILTRFINIRDFQVYANYWRLIIPFVLLILFLIHPKSSFSKIWLTLLFIIAVYLNVQFLGTLTPDTWLKLK